MTRATCMTMLSLAVAFWNYAAGRDISANMFLAVVLCIQGTRYVPDETRSVQWERIALACTILSAAICLYAAYGLAEGLQWKRPRSW